MTVLQSFAKHGIYPFFMISGSTTIIWGISSGMHHIAVIAPVLLISAIAILTLEKFLPFEPDWLKSKGDLNVDTIHYIVNYFIKLGAQLLFAYVVSEYRFLDIFPTSIPFAFQVILALAIFDFFLYWVHRLSHVYLFLWQFHAIHHSSERLYWLNGEKRHPLHQIIEGAPGILVLLFIGTPHGVTVAALAILAVNMMLQHCNVDYRAGFLKKIFSVAVLHRWHHRADYKDAQVNYGAWLILWDMLFGTYYDNPKIYRSIGKIGIAEEPNFPKTYLEQVKYPFVKGGLQK